MKKLVLTFILAGTYYLLSCSPSKDDKTTDPAQNYEDETCGYNYTEQSNKFFSYCVNNNNDSDVLFLALTSYECKSDGGSSLITSSNQASYKKYKIYKVCNDGVCPVNPNVATDIKQITSSTSSTVLYLRTPSGTTLNCTMED